MHGFAILPFMGLACCFSGFMLEFEGSLECIYVGYLGSFIHSCFGDGSGPVGRMTDQESLL